MLGRLLEGLLLPRAIGHDRAQRFDGFELLCGGFHGGGLIAVGVE